MAYARDNPCNSVELPRKTANEMQSLTPAEAARFLEAPLSDRWSALFVLALATGLRPSEYLGLQWADIDLEQGVINVQRALHWRSYKSGDWYSVSLRRRAVVAEFHCLPQRYER